MVPLSRMAFAAATCFCASAWSPRRAAMRACACSHRKFHRFCRAGLISGSFSPDVTYLVPLGRGIRISGVEANASRLVRNLSLLKEVLHAAVEVENLLFVFDCFVAITLESV